MIVFFIAPGHTISPIGPGRNDFPIHLVMQFPYFLTASGHIDFPPGPAQPFSHSPREHNFVIFSTASGHSIFPICPGLHFPLPPGDTILSFCHCLWAYHFLIGPGHDISPLPLGKQFSRFPHCLWNNYLPIDPGRNIFPVSPPRIQFSPLPLGILFALWSWTSHFSHSPWGCNLLIFSTASGHTISPLVLDITFFLSLVIQFPLSPSPLGIILSTWSWT